MASLAPDVSTATLAPNAVVGSRRRGLVLAVLSAVAFGISGVLCKVAMIGGAPFLTPSYLAQARITGAAFVLVVIVVIRRRGYPPIRWSPITVVALLGYGVLAFAVMQTLYFAAIGRLSVGVALLIEYLAPALVAVWALLVQRRPPTRWTWYAIGAALIGLALIARPWQGLRLDGLGVAAALGAAGALAATFLFGESLQRRMGGPQLAAMGAAIAAALLAVLQPWADFPLRVLGNRTRLGVPVWVLVVTIVLVGTVFAYLAGIAALRHLPAPIAAVVATLEVVVAAAVAWLLLGERLSGWEVGGGVLLLVGAVLAQRREVTDPSRPQPAASTG
jgi:drug/metabolite transporter (DMT)-like permease